jgi:hypothetical protein
LVRGRIAFTFLKWGSLTSFFTGINIRVPGNAAERERERDDAE